MRTRINNRKDQGLGKVVEDLWGSNKNVARKKGRSRFGAPNNIVDVSMLRAKKYPSSKKPGNEMHCSSKEKR